MHFNPKSPIDTSAKIIGNAKHVTVFTGAGISVESGIPPFRGAEGIWSKYNPIVLDISYFLSNPTESWKVIKEIFYDFFGKAKPNPAHFSISELEKLGIVKAVITQNIDGLHHEAGSKIVYEFHGTSKDLICINCSSKYPVEEVDLDSIPPLCPKCGGLLKPDFVFFGEQIPPEAHKNSFAETEVADVFLVVGTTGEIMPASLIPRDAKENGATIIEVNTAPSKYTNHITDIFLRGKASTILTELKQKIISI